MTNEQAIAMISHIKEYIVDNQGDKEYGGALDMAIEALEKIAELQAALSAKDRRPELKEYPKPEPYMGGYPPCYKESLCGGMGERACPMNQNYDYNTYKYFYKEGCPYRS